jgi:hypothetical protein
MIGLQGKHEIGFLVDDFGSDVFLTTCCVNRDHGNRSRGGQQGRRGLVEEVGGNGVGEIVVGGAIL